MKVIILFITVSFINLAWADSEIETIQLNHRLAVEVLPEIQAFLPEQATARAFNDFIVLKAEPSIIKEIKQLINKLDTPLQRLRISVVMTDERLSDRQTSQIEADILIDNTGPSANVSIQRWSTKNSHNKEQHYQAQGLAGKPILINLSQDIPQQEQYLVLRPDGDLAVQTNTSYLNINSGFQAVARILPNHQATVDIHPVFSHLPSRKGSIDRSQIITSISGPVGTWIELGQIDNEKNIEKQGATSYHSHRQLTQTIYIKVESLN
ncbi:MAG: hypothetical protein COB23_03830 [Methylophaga sp.]|nr:MAG: hypothetical protein COB23_03830 [Methylophaga sp.]